MEKNKEERKEKKETNKEKKANAPQKNRDVKPQEPTFLITWD